MGLSRLLGKPSDCSKSAKSAEGKRDKTIISFETKYFGSYNMRRIEGFSRRKTMDNEETIRLIEATIDKIRPFLNRDGGDIDFIGFRDGIVYVTMTGACQGCMMASADVSEGVGVLIMDEVPGVIGVQMDNVPPDLMEEYLKSKQQKAINNLYDGGEGQQ